MLWLLLMLLLLLLLLLLLRVVVVVVVVVVVRCLPGLSGVCRRFQKLFRIERATLCFF